MVGRPSRLSGSDRENLPDVREWSEMASWMFGSGREILPDDRVVWRPSRMSGCVRESLQDVR